MKIMRAPPLELQLTSLKLRNSLENYVQPFIDSVTKILQNIAVSVEVNVEGDDNYSTNNSFDIVFLLRL